MSAVHHLATGRPSGLPLALIAQAIPELSRHDLEALTARLIDHLDEMEGDADLEDFDPDLEEEQDFDGSDHEQDMTAAETFSSHYIAA